MPMPINFIWTPGTRRVSFTVGGTFTLHDILDALRSVLEIPEFGPGFEVLSDHRGVERPATVANVEDMLAFMREKRDRFQDVRWAVVTHRPASYAMMGLLSPLADLRVRMTVRVFTRMEDAEAWLTAA